MIDFSRTITDFDGNDLRDGDKPLTLATVSVRALVSSYEDEARNLNLGEEKFKRAELASRIYAATEPVKVKSEEITMLKKLIGKAWSPVIIFRSWPMLDDACSA
jgi:hypothetical protein